MLAIKEGIYKGSVVSIFWATQGTETLDQALVSIKARMTERFRCGDRPSAEHTPLLGNVAFIKTGLFEHPAALVTLTHELGSLFDVICVQVSPESYVAAVVNEASPCGCTLGGSIPVSEVKEHEDPWSKP